MKTYALIGAAAAMATAAPVPAQGTAKAPYTTADTPISTLLADPAAKAILQQDIPGLTENPAIGMVGGMNLRALQQMAPDKVTDAMLAKADADLAKLPVK